MASMTQTMTVRQPTASPEDKYVRRPATALPRSLIESSRVAEKQTFDVDRHVHFTPPTKIYSMKDLGLEGLGISPVAVSDPFPLFTEEAIQQIRGEIFSDRVLQKHQYTSSFCSHMIRGACPEEAPFTTEAWTHPRVLEAISQVAGVELIPCWNHEIANINVSVNMNTNNDELVRLHLPSDSESNKQDDTAFGWHLDSVPFVCVTMLSDCTGMIGGETVIRTGNGDCMKVRGPSMGTAVVMQGRYLEHRALKALGGRERISMVTALRPKCPLAKDETVLVGVRGISDLPELYFQYAMYRYQNLEERIRDQQKKIRVTHDRKKPFDIAAAREFLLEQRNYIDSMLQELYEVK